MLLTSMRKNNMTDPAIVLGHRYSKEQKASLEQFENVTIIDHEELNHRNLTCSKPVVMLQAKTDYVTWADCDAIFAGNCQKYLTPDPDHIHIRMRGLKENAMVFSHYYNKDEEIKTGIPRRILEIWREDIGESDKPKIKTCASACFLSLHTKHRPFIEKWRDQMYEVLPDDNVGVVDHRSIAYFQTDESVLNSVLCFSETAPPPTESYKLDKDPNAFFVHFVNHPKPWQMWNSYTASHFDKTVAIMEWAIDNGIKPPTLIPFSFSRKFRMVNLMLAPFGKTYSRIMKFLDSLE